MVRILTALGAAAIALMSMAALPSLADEGVARHHAYCCRHYHHWAAPVASVLVPREVTVTRRVLEPSVVQVPRTVLEARTVMVPRTVWEPRTVMVDRTVYNTRLVAESRTVLVREAVVAPEPVVARVVYVHRRHHWCHC
jgi:hypothetical protein